MATGILQSGTAHGAAADVRFFEGYGWCLNPMLSLRDQLLHLGEEIARYQSSLGASWEKEEHRINLHLFACAIACTLDDYLSARPWNLAAVTRRIPAARPAVRFAELALNAPAAWRSHSEVARAASWRRQWAASVDASCDLLLGGESQFCEQALRMLSRAPGALGEAALAQRMRIPEAFRCQDLTHHDVCAMVDLCLPALEKDRAIAIVGPRTAGAYFGPLAAAHLRRLGYTRVNWITVRPKNGLSSAESQAIAAASGQRAQLLIIDDHPNSGHTLRLLLGALRRLGAASRDMIVALPGHPSIPDFRVADEVERGVRIYLLPPECRYKARLLQEGAGDESDDIAALNAGFAAHYSDGFQVRLKRVVDNSAGRTMAKSAGWGWLGYHAWLAGTALDGFVPRVIRLRDGILFSEYLGGKAGQEPSPSVCANYIARRVSTLALREDPAFATAYRWCGWDDLVAVLSRIYGPRLGPFKKRAIRQRLRDYVAPNPTLVDGRMKPADWLRSGGRFLKTDFEHHNFGGGEADIVDPAWDLASAIYEFQFQPDAEAELLETYAAQTGDTSVAGRLPLYKILYAMNALRAAKYWLARRPDDAQRDVWNRQFTGARSFAAFHLARYLGRTLDPPSEWQKRLFFLDLDGVLDWGLLGFPHATPSGVHALQSLRQNRFSVVLNTARSLEHVREYCRAYKLPGGVAELGSVFWDALREWEVPLIDGEAATQLERLRDEIRSLPGAFVDPENRFSVRAYRFADGSMRPLRTAESEALIGRAEFHRLTFIESRADTYFVQKGAGKGQALASVQAYLGCCGEPVAAIGDSAQDVDMLRTADIAFAPANASREVRQLIARGQCRRTSRPLQAGLLEAAMEMCFAAGRQADDSAARRNAEPDSLLDELLRVPDRRPVERILGVLRRRGL